MHALALERVAEIPRAGSTRRKAIFANDIRKKVGLPPRRVSRYVCDEFLARINKSGMMSYIDSSQASYAEINEGGIMGIAESISIRTEHRLCVS